MTDFTLDIHKNAWISANGRHHWAALAKRKKHIRELAYWMAKHQGLIIPDPCIVVATIGYRTTGKADVENAAIAVKAAIDGMVTAGAIADDNSDHIMSISYRRGPKSPSKDHYRLDFKFIDQHVPF